MRFTPRLPLLLLLAAAPALAQERDAPPRIYRWIDENGVAHYTTDLERVPEELRDQPLRRETVSAQAPPAVDAWALQERVADPPAPPESAPSDAAMDRLTALDARIAELEQAIAADEELLKADLVDAEAPPANDTLREVAERMPARVAELKRLKAERDALAQPGQE